MKALLESLKEIAVDIIDYIYEASSESFIINSYEDAIVFFEKYKLFDNKQIIKSKLSKDDLQKMYETADKQNMPRPIIGNYQRKPGTFVFRRWVASINDELDIDVYKNTGPYKGLHNTKLREDGKYFPSAEDFEYVIAYSHNKNIMNYPDPDNIEFVSKKQMESNSKLEQIMEFYIQSEESVKRMSEPLKNIKSKFYKLPSINTTSKEWSTLGRYSVYGKNPCKVPKTDIISENGKYKLSLKKSGNSQLMSGGECESRATLMACIDYIKTEDDKNMLRDLLQNNWYKPVKDGRTISQKMKDNDPDTLKAKADMKQMTSKLNEILSRNPEFKRAVMYEAATGEIKFGKKSNASANYILIWNDIKSDNHLYTVNEYIDSHVNTAKFSFEFKKR